MLYLLFLILVAGSSIVNVIADCNSASSGDSSVYPAQFSTRYAGEGTYYGVYSNGGACSLDPTPPVGTGSGIYATVAIADNIWAGSKACGMCLNVTGTGKGSGATPIRGSFIVFVNNECPSCNNNGVDFGLSGDGVWDITWNAIPCPVSTKIQFVFQGANIYYIKLQARNTRYPVKGISITQNGKENALVRTADNFFLAGPSVTFPLTFPLTVKVTSVNGDYVYDSIASLQNGVVISGSTQFLECSGSTSSTTSVATTTTAATTSATTSSATTKSATSTATTSAATTTTKSTSTSATTKSATTATTSAATTTTAKSTTTTTTTGGAVVLTYAYQDSVAAGFEDWSWATTRNAQDSTKRLLDSYSYSFVPTSWEAVFFHCLTTGCINSNLHSKLQFNINPSGSGTKINFQWIIGSNPTGSAFDVATLGTSLTANTWGLATANVPSGSYDGFWFQDATGDTQSVVYLDEIFLVNK